MSNESFALSVTVIESDEETAEAPVESTTFSANVKMPLAVAVPLIDTEFPLLEPTDKPGGREPDASDQLNGAAPPDSLTAALYAELIASEGNDVVVTIGLEPEGFDVLLHPPTKNNSNKMTGQIRCIDAPWIVLLHLDE
ncbi:MAG TPA: hypothetical protein VJ731_05530 [Terriglobales bacterium]|nr:hypothetical protein [Terriglobales bacterium]